MTEILNSLMDEFKSVQSVSDLLAWHRPKVSGIVLGVLMSTILFYHFMGYTVVTFACRIFQLFFAFGACCGFIHKCKLESSEVQQAIDRFAERVTPCAASAIQKGHEILTWRDYVLSAKVFGATLIVGFFGNLMSDVFLAIVVLATAFTLPIVYEKRRTDIDRIINDVRVFFDQYFGKLMTNVDKAKSN